MIRANRFARIALRIARATKALRIFSGYFNLQRVFLFLRLFEITSETGLLNNGRALFRAILWFQGYFNLWRLSPKINLERVLGWSFGPFWSSTPSDSIAATPSGIPTRNSTKSGQNRVQIRSGGRGSEVVRAGAAGPAAMAL